jgi:hypothetical protein
VSESNRVTTGGSRALPVGFINPGALLGSRLLRWLSIVITLPKITLGRPLPAPKRLPSNAVGQITRSLLFAIC